ncbi:MAG: T9SS type A sorting domain-containing protein, partial [Bacteroidales bacterium]|nr:T9SS type A sorting domain-containing protein [Bacteroidales bacterium]
MKRFILIFFMVLISVRLMSQSVDVSFSGSTVYGRYIALDSVVVHNITRGWTATLVAPDTVCSLSVSSVDMLSAGNNGLQPNVPNPFHGKTEVEILLPAPDDVVIKVFDVGGRLYADYSGYLPEGNHRFEISLGTPQSYLLVLSTSEGMSSIKMLNLGSGGANSITYNGFVGNMSKLSVDMDFQRGDNLECTAYTTYADSVYEKRLVISPIEETHQVFRFNLKSGSADLQTA